MAVTRYNVKARRSGDWWALEVPDLPGVFSQAKRFYGLGRARCHTLARNQGRALAALTVFNLKRAAKLAAA